MESIVYPISTNYRKEWGEWASVREIVQNAIDSDGKASMDYDESTQTLIVEDDGSGFEPRHLMIGETEKDGESTIGMFGEGLKFALLALVRDGKEVSIKSKDKTYIPKLTRMFDRDALEIQYCDSEPYRGTQVTVKGLSQSYEDRFLSLDREKCFQSYPILDRKELFIKGIYVKPLKDSLCGYNLNIERENPISGDVSDYAIGFGIRDLIQHTEDRDYIKLLLRGNGTKEPQGHLHEYRCGYPSASSWYFSTKDLWIEIIEEMFGPLDRLCRRTCTEGSSLASYYGYKVLDLPANFLYHFIPDDIEAARKAQSNIKYAAIEDKDLDSDQLKGLMNMRAIVRYLYIPEIKKVQAAVFTSSSVFGCFEESVIFISSSILGAKKAFSVLLHEMVHARYGAEDASIQFINGLHDLVGDILDSIVSDGYFDAYKPSSTLDAK